ncbi:branched-chain amino acid transport system substrate-binding protein [Rhodoligotrophos appendicifer]|uniref:ABC transporter substrate-binding protein n=1 Tax=Rhodoligotrophos appendicifer TaxID=987056 RepID=UPI0011868783|nr:ABC transporter substrate-binding protein [Rhodoligotrophos appendicifer]
MGRKYFVGAMAAAAVLMTASVGFAQSPPLKIGILNDQNGPFADLGGKGSVLAAQMAVEDFGGKVLGRDIEIISADHQNKADIASSIATRWYDEEGVSAIVGLPVSSVALAVQFMAKERKKISITTGAGSTALIGKECSPTGFLWVYNTYSLAHGTALAVTKGGGQTWFFISSDYTFGKQLEKDATEVIEANGGKVLGAVRHPINSNDFSSFLVQAQASKAEVIGLANGGADTVNAIKQAAEFGIIEGGQKLAAMILFVQDVRSMGLDAAQGLVLTSGFYWDQNERTRDWSERFMKRNDGKAPSELQAGDYSAVMHYLKALAAAGKDDGVLVAEKMREIPVDDFMTKNSKIRADGYLQRDFYLFQVKTPAESKGEWDYFKELSMIPASEASPPVAGSECALLKN